MHHMLPPLPLISLEYSVYNTIFSPHQDLNFIQRLTFSLSLTPSCTDFPLYPAEITWPIIYNHSLSYAFNSLPIFFNLTSLTKPALAISIFLFTPPSTDACEQFAFVLLRPNRTTLKHTLKPTEQFKMYNHLPEDGI